MDSAGTPRRAFALPPFYAKLPAKDTFIKT